MKTIRPIINTTVSQKHASITFHHGCCNKRFKSLHQNAYVRNLMLKVKLLYIINKFCCSNFFDLQNSVGYLIGEFIYSVSDRRALLLGSQKQQRYEVS